MSEPVMGRIHSYETLGTVDGPGLRFVVFLQGCGLRCLYCHNPDTWDGRGGQFVSSDEVIKTILEYRLFLQSGGVTLSGGEPLLQTPFCSAILSRLKKEGIHTAVDTCGAVPLSICREAVELADMLLLDIKALDNDLAKRLTGSANTHTMEMLDYCQSVGKTIWLRHVLVPGYTMVDDHLQALADFLKPYTCIERIELLPFHKMGEYKWEEMKLDYKLGDVESPTEEEFAHAKSFFQHNGLPII